MKRVEVEWMDSVGDTGWKSRKSARRATNKHMQHVSCGYLLKQTDEYVLLVLSAGKHIRNVDTTMQIPRCSITAIHELRRKK